MLREIEIFTKQVEHKIRINLILVFLVLINREDKSSSLLISGVLPLRLDTLLEVLNRVDPPPCIFDLVAA
jgi:hypothetical protein